jgi:phosphoribosyl 1,2-cyclic phosphodiesterase
MIIRCYGARGSIPVSGEDYVKYGGDTTCLEIRTRNDEIIIVDAGSGIRRLGDDLLQEKRFEYHIIFTHSHLDHIMGFPFFMPIYHDETTINLKGCPATQGNLEKILSKAMSPPYFPVRYDSLRATINYSRECQDSFQVDSIEIFPIRLSHTNSGSGYKFVEDGKTFVFITDNELGHRHKSGMTFEAYAEFANNADLLIHDAEFTPEEYAATKTRGHSNYLDALRLGLSADVGRLGLFHHNRGRKDQELDRIVRECRNIIDDRNSDMTCFALTQNTELIV